MMCYRDQSFCTDANACAATGCSRKLTEKDNEYLAKNTWMPISLGTFKDTCGRYLPVLNGREFR